MSTQQQRQRQIKVFHFVTLLVTLLCAGDVAAVVIGSTVTGSLSRDGSTTLFDPPATTTVSATTTEFQGNIYSSSRAVVDGFTDFDDGTVTIGFRHVGGDLMLTNGTPVYEFSFSGLNWGLAPFLGLELVDSSPVNDLSVITRWLSDPESWLTTVTDTELVFTVVPVWSVGAGEELFATFAPVVMSAPASGALFGLGLVLLGARRRR